MLNALDLAGIPLHAADRTDDDPIVLAGGHAAFNPEPIADFLDAAVLGDGEEVVLAISEVIRDWKGEGCPGGRDELLRRLAVSGNIYVPQLLRRGVRRRRHHRGRRAQPSRHPVPGPQAHPDGPRRLALPAPSRWCRSPRPCTSASPSRSSAAAPAAAASARPGMITRPVRERSIETIGAMVENGIRKSGFEEVGLLSLSSADHTEIGEVAKGLADRYEGTNVSLSLPLDPRRRLQHHPRQRVLPQRPALRPDVRARGRLASGCAR